MPGESFRFLHASDFHLEVPLGDLDALPAHLKESLALAPRRAAQAVFDAALAENIDFLVLSGDLLHPTASGPHGMSLLLDGFEKLHEKKKPVFWAAGVVDDPKLWPESAPLPPNVILFPKGRTLSVPVERAGRSICTVVGRSSEGRGALHVPSYRIEPTDSFTVAVGYGSADAKALAEGGFDYWALGGDHNRKELAAAATGGAVYCGTPQGRSLSEPGPHGFTVVDVDADRNVRLHAIECDTFRYVEIKVDAAEIEQLGSLRNLLGERLVRLQHEHGGRHLIIAWDVAVSTGESLHHVGDTDELLRWARREFGHGTPAAWTTRLTIQPPRQYPKTWQDEDTILGDYLRAADRHHKADARELNLLPFTEEHRCGEAGGLPATATSLLGELPASTRATLLDQATRLGVELLRGGKPSWVQKS